MAKSIKKTPALPVVAAAHPGSAGTGKHQDKESPIKKVEEALLTMEILYRIPQNLQGDNFINIIHHYEDVIKKNIEKLVNQ